MSSHGRKAPTDSHRGRGSAADGGGGGVKKVSFAMSAAAAAAEATEIGDNTCVVCFKVVEIFSIGECDHPVCYECSTRMRVLCKQNECPICRTDMSKVMFTREILSFRQLEINNRTGLYDKKHRICFSTAAIQEVFNALLENPCTICEQGPFPNFASLRDHVKKKHEQFYCDICTENLSVFSFERKSYNRTELGIHRRKGDPDNKSHRGHPLCEYCDLRFFDRDELFKHLRREHFYCHFCDADGANCYYADYAALRVHFGKDHYLCEDGDCAQEQFTAVFRTEIDLKAHIANIHGQGLGRLAAKQIRTLELEITLAPRNRQGGDSSRGGSGSSGYRGNRNNPADSQHEFDTSGDHGMETMTMIQAPQRVIDAQNEQEFPSLGGSSGGAAASFSMRPNVSIRHSYGPGGLARTKENFPALGGNGSGGGGAPVTPSTSGSGSYKQGSASSLLKSANKPAQKQGVVIHVSNRPNSSAKKPSVGGRTNANDFPSLAGTGKKALLETDFVAPTAALAYSNNIASKHRQLIDGYEPHDAGASAKVAIVQQRPEAAAKKSATDVAPKINSKNNFPTLGNSLGAAMAPQWVTLTKKAPVESRKTKVAPPPLATTANSYPALEKPAKTSAAIATSTTKKDVKSKPAAKQPEKQSAAAAVPSVDAKAKSLKKSNVSRFHNNNNEANEDDANESEFVPSATVLNAVSAKHRSMVDSYESIAKPGVGSANKLSMVQRDTTSSSAKTKTNAAVPQLSSKNMFPSLSSNGTVELNNNPNGINFTDIMRNANASTAAAVAATSNGNKADRKNSPRHSNNNGDLRTSAPGPPPGFGSTTTTPSAITTVPPPGFNSVTLNSVVKPLNNLTFTTSLGESFSILPTHSYLAPPNCAKRNQALFALFQTSIPDPDVVESFKQVSQLFINDSYNALPYYEHCQAALADQFDAIFPELLALLPDIGKQQELYLVHSQQQALLDANSTTKASNKKRNQTLEVCATCKQVLITSDLVTHLQSHSLENNFPTLNHHASQSSSAWKK